MTPSWMPTWARLRHNYSARWLGSGGQNIGRAKDTAWRDRLEQQQVSAKFGRMFGRVKNPLQAMRDHAKALREELRQDASARALRRTSTRLVAEWLSLRKGAARCHAHFHR